jgi:phosphate transport system substrate-binding protein
MGTNIWGIKQVVRMATMAVSMLVATSVMSQSVAETIIIQGSTTFNRRIMEPFKGAIEADSKHELTIIPNKSVPGLIALMEGRAQIAMISASLKSEIEVLQKVMPGLAYERLQSHEISSTRVAITVHPSNGVRKATLNQIRKVLLGEITNWLELGGKDTPIRVVLVGGGGGVTRVVESELLSGQTAKAKDVIYVKTPVQLVQVVEQETGAIGFAQLALAKQRNLPELMTEQPIEQVLSMVTHGAPSPAVTAVIAATRKAAEKSM